MRIFPTKRGSTAWLRHLISRDQEWRLIDAKDQVLGRVAQQAAILLLGKHKPYSEIDNIVVGDPVIVINARHFVLMGRRATNREFIHHSGYPGGLKRVAIADVMRRRPKLPFRKAVYNMLPRNRLRKKWMANLHIYLDDEHPHQGQNPVKVGPAHMRLPIKNGGPPDIDELSHWWVENLASWQTDIQSREDSEGIDRFISKAHSQFSKPFQTEGLRDLLTQDTIGQKSGLELDDGTPLETGGYQDPTQEQNSSVADDPLLSSYVSAADSALKQPGIIVPSLSSR